MSRASIDRRGFLLSLGRYSAATGLLAGARYLITRRAGEPGEFECFRPVACGECATFGKCTLPRAVAMKETIAGNGGADHVRVQQ